MLHEKPNPKICQKALAQLKQRTKGKPWAEVVRLEAAMWRTTSDCPALGLYREGEPKVEKRKPFTPSKKPFGEKLGKPISENARY